MSATSVADRAAELHRSAIIINGLGGGKVAMPDRRGGEFQLPSIMREGGVTSVNLTVAYLHGFEISIEGLSWLLQAVDASEGISIARTVKDIEDAKRAGEATILVGFQNSDPIEGSLDKLDLFYRLGLRIMQLTYQRRNLVADGGGEPANGGLSVFGRELVAELNRLGVLIDLSHTGVRSTLDTIEASSVPVAFTHANLYTKNPVRRNKTDEEIKALAARGGVMGINSIARMISPEGWKRGATVHEFVDQIDYVVDLVGIDHVGIGLDISEGMSREDFELRRTTGFLGTYPELGGGDFPYEYYYMTGVDSMAKAGLITEALVERGYSDDDVLKILGGNFLRLLGEVFPGG